MKTALVLLLLLQIFFYTTTFTQNVADICNCEANFNQTISKVVENYAGYPAKIEKEGKQKYDQLVDSLSQMADGVTDPRQCFHIISAYVTFFEDAHLGFSYQSDHAVDKNLIDISADLVKERIKDISVNFIEGIWEKADSSLAIAIVRDTSTLDNYQGIVLQSSNKDIPKGLVYFRLTPSTFGYTVKYYNSFSSSKLTGKQRKNLLQVGDSDLWLRKFPHQVTEKELQEVRDWKKYDRGLRFEQLNEDFAYLKIPTFRGTDTQIEKLIAAHDSLIRNTPNLIIDLRGNGGGQNGWIHFLPYLYTQPVFQGYAYYKISEDNKKEVNALLDAIANQPLSEDMKQYFTEEDIERKKQEFAEFKDFEGEFFPISGITLKYDSIMRYPENVILIVDEQAGSSTEFFMNLCKQSKKTFTFGRNTFGMMDYQGASSSTALPYPDYYLYIPISKSDWTDKQPTNDNGFEPDVFIPNSIPHDDWVDFVMHSIMELQ